jgi:hypothetical protein
MVSSEQVEINMKLSKKYRFGEFGKTLPSEALLRRYKDCHDLSCEYLYLKGQAVLLGESLDAKFARGGGNPAKRAFKRDEIDRYGYLLIHKLTGVYQAVFNLIQGTWEELEDSFAPMGVSNEIELFCEVLREHFDNKFKKCILGHKLTCTDVHTTAKLFREKIFPVLSDPVKVGEVLPGKSDYFWLTLILKETRQLSRRDIIVKELLQVVDCEVSEFVQWHSSYLKTCQRKPNSEENLYSIKWEKQNLYVGCLGGYTHVLNKTQSYFSELSPNPSLNESGNLSCE